MRINIKQSSKAYRFSGENSFRSRLRIILSIAAHTPFPPLLDDQVDALRQINHQILCTVAGDNLTATCYQGELAVLSGDLAGGVF